jgi:hypothetical protein
MGIEVAAMRVIGQSSRSGAAKSGRDGIGRIGV